MRKGKLILLLMMLGVLAGIYYGATHFTLSTLDDPGRVETYLATRGKQFAVGRSVKNAGLRAPGSSAATVAMGEMIYHGACDDCHGIDGRTPSEIGRAMYPRTLSLASMEVQSWSDEEMFWIIKNGIRLSGMPGFAKTQSDDQIWSLVHYIRSLAPATKRGS